MDINESKNESPKAKTIMIILVALALAFVAFLYLANRKAKNPAIVPTVNKATEATPSVEATPSDTKEAESPEAVPASEIVVPDSFKGPTAMPPELEKKINSSK